MRLYMHSRERTGPTARIPLVLPGCPTPGHACQNNFFPWVILSTILPSRMPDTLSRASFGRASWSLFPGDDTSVLYLPDTLPRRYLTGFPGRPYVGISFVAGTPLSLPTPPEATPGGYGAARASRMSCERQNSAIFRLPVTLNGQV